MIEYIGCDRTLLERQAEQLGISLDESASIRRVDLPRLVGPVATRSILRGVDATGPEGVGIGEAASILKVGVRHVMGLIRRRGVWTAHSGGLTVLSRSGVVTLARILERERAFPVLEDDFFPAQADVPQPRLAGCVARIWPARRRPSIRDSADPGRYRDLGVRWREDESRRSASGGVRQVGFDMYRLLGITRPGMRLEAYRDRMDRAVADETDGGAVVAPPADRNARGRVA